MIHNTLHKNTIPLPNIIGKNCFIHPTAVLDVEGMHVTKSPDGSRIQIKHLGNVVLEDDISVFALSTLQRAVFGSTIIKRGVKIDSHVNIGHNSYIGEDSVIALGAIIGGSVKIGRSCMIGLGVTIRNGVSICDNVIVGMGSNVVSNITDSGIYMGSPAKFYKSYSEGWNF
jgi:UDP-3-O-[3-hydroxymyristoyl] glucosamine N-acyltransferase